MTHRVSKQKIRSFVTSFWSFYTKSELDLTSVAVAYYLIISIFPILLTLANLLPYLQIDVDQILQWLMDLLPEKLYPMFSSVVVSILTQPSSSWLGISLLTTLWTLSKSMDALQKAFNKAYGVEEHRDFIVSRMVGMFLGMGLQLIISLGVLVLAFGNLALQMLQRLFSVDGGFVTKFLSQTEPVVYTILFLALLMLYYVLPNVRITKIRYILPGVFFVMIVMMTLGQLFNLYLTRYADRLLDFRLVTALVLLVMMLWFIFVAQVLIIGAVLNATVQSQYMDCFSARNGDIFSVWNRFCKLIWKPKKERKKASSD